jgi:hypothetical protein
MTRSRVFPLAEMFLDDAPLVPAKMGIMKRDSSRKQLAPVQSGLRGISRRKIGQGFGGWWKAQRLREIVSTVPRLARSFAEDDHLFVFADEPLHQGNHPVAVLAFVIERLDQSLLR